ncbi:TolC family protein [Hufsiella ginkgonis]|uniref:Efflux transporter outer membrane subunit n=1 Tax=Hufsiella ginkgonis TaxID=2695274 RepID=A0A7K1Y1X8_9SPHI|nr:TolC family protein [Hufsiella ginkgonis]MXV17245.1 efflux transporter outer membrane subunit [Hufsiella ginkgonis]
MYKINKIHTCIGLLGLSLAVASCKVPAIVQTTENKQVPGAYNISRDTTNTASLPWRSFFTDPHLAALIDTALKNNQELNVTLQEIEMAKNDIRFRKGQILPTVGAKVGIGVEKVGRYTSQGAGDASTEIAPGKETPDPLMDYTAAVYANWEVDIWKKLRTAKKAAVTRYLATVEGKNFVLTNLVAEVANSYYELLALDNQLEMVKQNIGLQENALEIVKVQKEASRVTELAVQKFQAEVLNSQSLEFEILQNIKETENKINFLLARYPQEIPRDKSDFFGLMPAAIHAGVPSQLLANRPDLKRAELELMAARLDVKVARAEFYPSFGISAALGFQAFKPSYLVKFPESMLYSLAGDLAGPLVNRNAIKAEFYNANARQLQAMYDYQRTILNAYLEVSTQLSRIDNLEKSYDLKSKQVDALTKSIDISNDLFKSARADYLEVLMTQRDALESRLELIETKKGQLNAIVNVYRDLGGGWK